MPMYRTILALATSGPTAPLVLRAAVQLAERFDARVYLYCCDPHVASAAALDPRVRVVPSSFSLEISRPEVRALADDVGAELIVTDSIHLANAIGPSPLPRGNRATASGSAPSCGSCATRLASPCLCREPLANPRADLARPAIGNQDLERHH